jgi:hypothetical protein
LVSLCISLSALPTSVAVNSKEKKNFTAEKEKKEKMIRL